VVGVVRKIEQKLSVWSSKKINNTPFTRSAQPKSCVRIKFQDSSIRSHRAMTHLEILANSLS
jgi:hypothetical protein